MENYEEKSDQNGKENPVLGLRFFQITGIVLIFLCTLVAILYHIQSSESDTLHRITDILYVVVAGLVALMPYLSSFLREDNKFLEKLGIKWLRDGFNIRWIVMLFDLVILALIIFIINELYANKQVIISCNAWADIFIVKEADLVPLGEVNRDHSIWVRVPNNTINLKAIGKVKGDTLVDTMVNISLVASRSPVNLIISDKVTIKGNVLVSNGKGPLEGCTVGIKNTSIKTQSNAEGRFEIKIRQALLEESGHLTFEKKGYKPMTVHYLEFEGVVEMVRITPPPIPPPPIPPPPIPTPQIISGRVVDEEGMGLVGVTIEIIHPGTHVLIQSTLTDKNGNYSVAIPKIKGIARYYMDIKKDHYKTLHEEDSDTKQPIKLEIM